MLLALALMVGCGIFFAYHWLKTPRIWSLGVTEASGMAPMSNGDRGFWIVNDSGGTPQVHAISPTGQHLGSVTIINGWNRDWESVATGPCGLWLAKPDAARINCLFIGNLGSNGFIKRAPTIVIIEEPKPGATVAMIAREVRIEYPGEGVTGRSPDIEAIALRSDGNIVLFAKWAQNRPTSMVYQVTPTPAKKHLPTGPIEAIRATSIAMISRVDTAGRPVGPFTDAALSPDQSTLFIRDYRGIYRTFLPKPDGRLGTLYLTLLPSRPVLWGEAIAISHPSGKLVYTSEGLFAPLLTLEPDEPTDTQQLKR
jgi:hypothetical protein